MKRKIMRFLFFIFIFLGLSALKAQAKAPLPLAAKVNLGEVLEGKDSATVDAGDGVTFRFGKSSGTSFVLPRRAEIVDKGKVIKEFSGKGVDFVEYGRLSFGSATYWVLTEHTGGAPSNFRYHFLARPERSKPVRYLGHTRAEAYGGTIVEESFFSRQGQLFFRDWDARFVSFHTVYAFSRFKNIPRYHRLTPWALEVDNRPFKDVYIREAQELAGEIGQELAARKEKPEAILTGEGRASFSDDVGQLLVLRTILYLYAREDQKAWSTLAAEVKKYYQTFQGLEKIKQGIIKELGRWPC
jgi:hypothetical protein